MTEVQKFTERSNARRAAKRLLSTGAAPAIDFHIEPANDGGFVIHWHTPEAVEAEVAMTPDQALDSVCGAGTAADMPRLLAAAEPELEAQPKAKRTRRAAKTPAAAPKGPRAVYAAPVAPGEMPTKPTLTAAGFAASYQKRIDRLAELAEAGDWNAVEAFAVNGKNTYSKIVARYRDQLVAAHAAAGAPCNRLN